LPQQDRRGSRAHTVAENVRTGGGAIHPCSGRGVGRPANHERQRKEDAPRPATEAVARQPLTNLHRTGWNDDESASRQRRRSRPTRARSLPTELSPRCASPEIRRFITSDAPESSHPFNLKAQQKIWRKQDRRVTASQPSTISHREILALAKLSLSEAYARSLPPRDHPLALLANRNPHPGQL
jgi:hypothetical protein